ncbi:MAG: response regulator transcription factor [Anaerolineaceae bacterium]
MANSQQPKILLVEGRRNPTKNFAADLLKKGYSLQVAENGTHGIQLLKRIYPAVIIINAASLRTNGTRIVSRFQNRLPEVPVILILSEDEDEENTSSANVVLRLPFTVQKLVNRLKVFEQTEERHLVRLGPLQLNLQTNLVTYFKKETRITPRLTRLLKQLMEQPGVLVPREELFRQVWDTDYTGDTRTLDVHISWLRRVLESDPNTPLLITTVRGKGYKLNL